MQPLVKRNYISLENQLSLKLEMHKTSLTILSQQKKTKIWNNHNKIRNESFESQKQDNGTSVKIIPPPDRNIKPFKPTILEL